MIERDTIYTYADGTPIEGRPDDIPACASANEKILYMRKWNTYCDRVMSVGNDSFDEHFREGLQKWNVASKKKLPGK